MKLFNRKKNRDKYYLVRGSWVVAIDNDVRELIRKQHQIFELLNLLLSQVQPKGLRKLINKIKKEDKLAHPEKITEEDLK